ncbi:MAG TPA: carboxymuconolactone decarboxylase family protein [Mycobacteriales bacterium]|jgi:AhpD family alkylhydroperoxidase|nr:carboxymuconolactone decarboxylase family protein [Mycobacteriales bacterium]
MARISLPDGDQLDIVKALSLRPDFAKAVGAMNAATFSSSLDWRLHELVRMRIAILNGCTVCLSWRSPEAVEAGLDEDALVGVAGWRDGGDYTDAEQVALEFTELFCGDSVAISDELMARLEQHFDAGEIVELSLVIGKYLSQGRFMQVLGLDQTCSLPDFAAPVAALTEG